MVDATLSAGRNLSAFPAIQTRYATGEHPGHDARHSRPHQRLDALLLKFFDRNIRMTEHALIVANGAKGGTEATVSLCPATLWVLI